MRLTSEIGGFGEWFRIKRVFLVQNGQTLVSLVGDTQYRSLNEM